MPSPSLRAWLMQQPGFQSRLDALLMTAVRKEFPSIEAPAGEAEAPHDWPYLLLCASALARSDVPAEQRAALRIADTCLQLDGRTGPERAAAAVILDTMANRRTIDLAKSRQLVSPEVETTLPLPLQGDHMRREVSDSVHSSDGAVLPLNRFQCDLWRACQAAGWVSASAPTSAGKSFLLRAWVRDCFHRRPAARIVFVVPTRALIQEVTDDFGEDLLNGGLRNVMLHALPLEASFDPALGHLFIFTQERLHILLGREPELMFDVLIVDEAHKIGDGHRGVLLEQVIHECVRRSPATQVIFAAPHAENPGYLLEDAPEPARAKPVDREVTTVSQNLLFASQQRGKPMQWHVAWREGEKSLPLGMATLAFRATSELKRLSAVAFTLRAESGNLVYANDQAQAEKIAEQIADAYTQAEVASLEVHPAIVELVKLVHRTIHPKYKLIETLKQGVAFHYGNMPLLVRLEIESLFRKNILRFLICTSTLMEGVNLPCKVIFLRGPKKGRGSDKHLTPSDFWNLAGRAGRWGTEFQGTIVCIDPSVETVWTAAGPPTSRIRQTIRSTTEENLTEKTGLLAYLDAGCPEGTSQKRPELDYSASFLLAVLARGESLRTIAHTARLPESQRLRLEAALAAELDAFRLSRELIFDNPGVLPRSMTKLNDYFATLTPEQLAEHVPIAPESNDASARYHDIFKHIDEYLRANFAHAADLDGKRLWQLAFLTVDWMRGKPLAYLISDRERRSRNRVPPIRLPVLIRAVMTDVEEYARFKIPRFLRCYLGVLQHHAQERDLQSIMKDLPKDLELWLELGVSVRTALSLMELGLSRTSAVELFDSMTNAEMSPAEVLAWLRERDVEAFDLPEIMKEEIRRILLRHSKPVA